MASRSTSSRGIPRLAIIVTIAVAVVIVGVLVAISASGGGSSSGGGEVRHAAEVTAQFGGIPQQGDRLGRSDAPVEIVEYADLQCPYCAEASRQTVPELVDRYVRPGMAKLTFRPLAFIGPDSRRGALALVAAGQQDRMWTYAELLYRNQGKENSGWLSERVATDAAGALGMDVPAFDAARGGAAASAALASTEASAQADGVRGTPTFVVIGPKGRIAIRDFTNLGEFASAVQAVG